MFNANNYGYNPYGRYVPQQPTEQPMYSTIPTRSIINGKVVDSIDVVKTIEYPLDGSTSYYPLASGEAIVTKQLQNDGTTKITIFKPVQGENKEIKYITGEDLKKALDGLDFSELDDIKDDIKDLRQELKDLRKKKKDD